MGGRGVPRRDRWTCPWSDAGWRAFASGVAGSSAAVAAAAGATALAAGDVPGALVALAGGGAVVVGSSVAGAVIAEDRASAEPQQLTRSWRAARAEVARLDKAGRRLPAGPLRQLVAAQVDAMQHLLALDRERLVALWDDLRATARLHRQATREGEAAEQAVRGLVEARQRDEHARAVAIGAHLDRLTAACGRLRVALADRAAIDRVTAHLPPSPTAAPLALPPADGPDALAAALEELAELERVPLPVEPGP